MSAGNGRPANVLEFAARARVLRSPPSAISHTLAMIRDPTFGQCTVNLHPAGDVLWVETERGQYFMLDVEALGAAILSSAALEETSIHG